MIRVLIADDHRLIRAGVRAALTEAGFEIAGEVSSGDDVLSSVRSQDPEVVLLDLRMPGVDSIACVREIRQQHPDVKVVMLSASEDPEDIASALDAGASAYVGKRIAPGDLGSALRQVVEGTVPHRAPTVDERRREAVGLTDRERTMLDALLRGLSTKAISSELWISEKTVKFHLTNLYRKLGVHNRASAMRYAHEHGLVPRAVRAATRATDRAVRA